MDDIETSAELQKFFEKASKDCTCHWPNPLFNSVLAEYIKMRQEVHRTRKAGRLISYTFANALTMQRHRLETLAPCRDCITKFNPTNRLRNQIWNPSRKRAYKELFS